MRLTLRCLGGPLVMPDGDDAVSHRAQQPPLEGVRRSLDRGIAAEESAATAAAQEARGAVSLDDRAAAGAARGPRRVLRPLPRRRVARAPPRRLRRPLKIAPLPALTTLFRGPAAARRAPEREVPPVATAADGAGAAGRERRGAGGGPLLETGGRWSRGLTGYLGEGFEQEPGEVPGGARSRRGRRAGPSRIEHLRMATRQRGRLRKGDAARSRGARGERSPRDRARSPGARNGHG